MALSNVDARGLKDVFHFLLNFDADNIPLLTLPLFFFCPVVLILVCPARAALVSLFLSSRGENEGTPSEKWGIQFYSLKIIGLSSIKTQ